MKSYIGLCLLPFLKSTIDDVFTIFTRLDENKLIDKLPILQLMVQTVCRYEGELNALLMMVKSLRRRLMNMDQRCHITRDVPGLQVRYASTAPTCL